MTESKFVSFFLRAFVVSAMGALTPAAFAQAKPALILENTIVLPEISGRIDHMDFDAVGDRLFVAALASDAVVVVDVAAGKRTVELRPFNEPQGLRFVPSLDRLFVANGHGGGVVAFVGGVSPATGAIPALRDADNLRFDPSSQMLVAGFDGALAVIDPMRLAVVKTIALAGHPEAFAIERSGRRAFVNVPTAGHVAVIDLTAGKVSATWALHGAAQNFPMALDEDNQRLFIVTRQPSLVLVFDTTTGHRVAELPTCGDSDDLYFDESRKQIYAICGQGVVDVFRQVDRDRYESVARITTAVGARTGFFASERSKLFVAAPARGVNQAEVRVYEVTDPLPRAASK